MSGLFRDAGHVVSFVGKEQQAVFRWFCSVKRKNSCRIAIKALNLYFFDKKLRVLLFTAMQSFEIALRSKLIHHFSMVYGAFWIMDRSLFADKKIFTDCSIRIQQEVFRSKEDFIQEHFDKYANLIMPPVWKMLEVVSCLRSALLLGIFAERYPSR